MSKKNTLYDRQHEAAITSLLQHTTLQAAAKAIGLNDKTMRRWWVRPDFQEKYRAAKRELMNGAVHALLHATSAATHVLVTIMQDATQPANARVGAARCILQTVMGALHQDDMAAALLDLQTRLSTLERQDVESNHDGAH